ncbi:helix-turn-helix domain-containing protein [Gorillibacterium sp. sgz5001074]|uniref:helix-turn-helix domain-containing protein n=1 Tax=Gorillibacterium sp. sgz5001074 TaxID=3446695 RepID=UPI003F669B62
MIHKRIEQLRLKRGLTHEEVATRIGVARPTYSNYESGKREPDLKTVDKLANLFETNVDYLLGRTDDPSPIGKPAHMPTEWVHLYDQILELGLELEATAILRTASGMSKETLEDVLKVLKHIKSEKENPS